MKNTILKFDTLESDEFIYYDYTSKNLTDVHTFIENLSDDFYEWQRLDNNDRLERIAYSIYGSGDYWDILAILNDMNPLFDMPYDLNVVFSKAQNSVNEFSVKDPLVSAPQKDVMYERYKELYTNDNENFRVLKIVKPSKIQEFLRLGYEAGVF